jgi:hypothetical protein
MPKFMVDMHWLEIILVPVMLGVWLLSYKWPSTEGTVVDSRDTSFTICGIGGTSGSSLDVPVEYKETVHDYVYEVTDRMYRCSTYCFGGWAENATAAYAIDTKVRVYCDPKRPEVAVLRRGLQFGAIFGLVPIGAAFLWLYLWRRE